MHARSGGNIEVMGLMIGKVVGDTMVVLDSFALPVQGTETRVNAGYEANEYMVQYLTSVQRVGRQENACGWYHSHPGYGCWLSGIDVSTQLLYQTYQDPFIAVVVDPTRTISAGKIEIGAFRTYPEGYKPLDEGTQRYQTIPLAKIEDFGVHCKSYYPLDVTYFKSSLDAHLLDLLWHKYWVNTLSSSPLVANRSYAAGQIADLAEKLEQAEQQVTHGGGGGGGGSQHRAAVVAAASAAAAAVATDAAGEKKPEETVLARVTKDCTKLATEQGHGLISLVMKDILFNFRAEVPVQAK
jgi:COP9 signalosome complex subunit 5